MVPTNSETMHQLRALLMQKLEKSNQTTSAVRNATADQMKPSISQKGAQQSYVGQGTAKRQKIGGG